MKISFFYTIVSILLAIVIGYFTYDNLDDIDNDLLYTIGTAGSLLCILLSSFAMNLKSSRANINLKVWGLLAFFALLIIDIALIYFCASVSICVLIVSIFIIIHLIIVRSLYNADNI